MKWFFGGLLVLAVVAIALVLFDKPKPPVSLFNGTQVETAVNTYRVQNGLPAFKHYDKLQEIVQKAIDQVGQQDVKTANSDVSVQLETNSSALGGGYVKLYAIDINDVAGVLQAWEADPQMGAALLNPSFNIFGVATGQSHDGVQFTFALVAHCTKDC